MINYIVTKHTISKELHKIVQLCPLYNHFFYNFLFFSIENNARQCPMQGL